MNNPAMEQLMKERSSAKAKLTLGIIFTAVGQFFVLLSFLYVPLILLAIPFFGVGVPFLIIGIVKTSKASAKINAAQKAAYNVNPAPAAPVAQPVQHVAPQAAPVVAEQPAPPAEPVAQPVVEEKAEPVVQAAARSESAGGTAELNWQKYKPLDAGVSYKAGKDYKFHRADGFVGSVPQKFVDRTFPKCPICCSNEPHWTIAQHNQMSWKGNLYLFKCSHCESIISMSMPDVTTLGNGGGGVAANPSVGLTNLMVKATSGKEAGAVYAVIESVGKSGIAPDCEGKEFKLEDLQDMFLRS